VVRAGSRVSLWFEPYMYSEVALADVIVAAEWGIGRLGNTVIML